MTPLPDLLFDLRSRRQRSGTWLVLTLLLAVGLGSGLTACGDDGPEPRTIEIVVPAGTSERLAECESAFRAARAADPAFALSRSEAGHPLWGPVYRRVLPPLAWRPGSATTG